MTRQTLIIGYIACSLYAVFHHHLERNYINLVDLACLKNEMTPNKQNNFQIRNQFFLSDQSHTDYLESIYPLRNKKFRCFDLSRLYTHKIHPHFLNHIASAWITLIKLHLILQNHFNKPSKVSLPHLNRHSTGPRLLHDSPWQYLPRSLIKLLAFKWLRLLLNRTLCFCITCRRN